MVEKRKNNKTVIGRVARRGSPSRAQLSEHEKGPQRQDPVVLAVDVGNTYIHFAFFLGDKIVRRDSVKTVQTELALKRSVAAVLKRLRVDQVLVCSVVPAVTKVLEPLFQKSLGVKAGIIGRDIIVPIKNRYSNPKQVGQDRLVCAYAASEMYGHPAIVIDLGTAITLDVVSARREYLGGIIVPGIHITAETLFERTALLPLVEITKPKHLIGKDTQGSILSGIFYGYGEMLKGLIGLLSKDSKTAPKVILTGGHAKLMAEYIKDKVKIVEPDLVFKGILLLAKN